MRPSANDWIVAYDSTRVHGKPPMSMECLRCGGTLVPSLPISATTWCRLAKVFEHEHAECREKDHA